MLALVLVLVVASLVVRAGHDGEALPGTRVAGVDVGGITTTRIASRLRPVVGDQRTLRLRAAGDVVTIKAADLGYAVDLQGIARAAVAAGRDGTLNALVGPLRGYVSARTVPVRSSFDEAKARKALAPVARKVARGAYAGALKVDPETLQVSTTKPRAGRAVDMSALVARVRRELREGDGTTFDVPLRSVDAAPESQLQEIASEAEDYLRQPLRLTGAGSPLTLTTAQTAAILALESRQGGRRAELGAGGEALSALLDRVEKRGRKLPRNATVSAPATSASLTDKGDVTWRPRSASVTVKAGRVGREVRRDRLASRIESAVAAGKHSVSVPRVAVQPKVTSATARRIDSVIGTFTTPYVPGQPRVTNIRQMARTVDGTLIAPGQQFSLNGITGERTKAKGYVEAPFIANNRIEPSVGGGVSQFSTTMYNAAYFAGLQIDAHRAHSLYIDRYPPGRESTLNFPDIDMRWTNDTEVPVLVRTSYDDAGVTVTLYGDNGGRRVTAKAGDREKADGGDFQITVTRTVRYGDGRTDSQAQTTRYENEQQGETE
ncbi:VanW family protein [Patulibacter sp.]|uniref:VanW family protein n=1 Tax=Patulibacter sp. TaxID=1912859 RepID=UPI002716C795|nr:VanW family protein [Patulibacter sp.]MDO9409758.1 VanW family protein [Patulibacter sp.]